MPSKQYAYLLGLITGRGHIYPDSKRIVIEFSHNNKYVSRITHCEACGNLVTGFGQMKCKGCGRKYSKEVVKTYEQVQSTINSLNNSIIPYLSQSLPADFRILGNDAMTLLTLDFGNGDKEFNQIQAEFTGQLSFDRFSIPQSAYKADRSEKIEFVNGLLDTAGFNNAGGWLPREGKNGHGRMRSYFQIVRNWKLPVEIDNFLRREFDLPIQTIDWGHPNIRDSQLEDYYNTRDTSWSREHQVKFFPEYYQDFSFRIEHKQKLFEELADHNLKMVFDRKEDWLPPGPVKDNQMKPFHPGEADLRIPKPARRHFDKFWQINAAMGCTFIAELAAKAPSFESFVETGDVKAVNLDQLIARRNDIRQSLADEIAKKYAGRVRSTAVQTRATSSIKEQHLYEPLVGWLKSYLEKEHTQEVITVDVSAGNLDRYVKNEAALEAFDFCRDFRIKPDVVGFLMSDKKLVFIEAKITSLTLKEIGQLLGYCMVAQPVEAILVSTKAPSNTLVRTIHAHPDLLSYGEGKKMKLARWVDNKMNWIDV